MSGCDICRIESESDVRFVHLTLYDFERYEMCEQHTEMALGPPLKNRIGADKSEDNEECGMNEEQQITIDEIIDCVGVIEDWKHLNEEINIDEL